MRIGKISEAVLNRSVLKEIRPCKSGLITGPAVGEDASVLRMGENVVVSSAVSPDIGADPEIRTILAIHAAVNNVAASGALCHAIVVNIVLAEGTEEGVGSRENSRESQTEYCGRPYHSKPFRIP